MFVMLENRAYFWMKRCSGLSNANIPSRQLFYLNCYHLFFLRIKSQWNEPWNRKYTKKSTCLPMSQVQRLGRQILEALLFLRERGFPSHGHLHSGNVILQNGVARYVICLGFHMYLLPFFTLVINKSLLGTVLLLRKWKIAFSAIVWAGESVSWSKHFIWIAWHAHWKSIYFRAWFFSFFHQLMVLEIITRYIQW